MDYRQFFIDAIANRDYKAEVIALSTSGHEALAEDLVSLHHGEWISDSDLFRLAAVIFHADSMGK